MKHLFFLLILATTFAAANCHKEGPDCHHNITIKNNTTDTIIITHRFTNIQGLCQLSGSTLKPVSQDTDKIYTECWENSLSKGNFYEIYIIDPSKYNVPNTFYSCDSIEFRNKILKHYVLTLEDLKRNNFTITYP